MIFTDFVLAMAGGPAGGGGVQQPGGGLGMFMPMLLIFAIFYFMLIRPQQRKEKERRKMIDELKSGARVLFSGGIMGVVTNVKEHTFIIKIADNVKVEVLKSAVAQVMEKGEKPQEEKN